MQRADLVVTGEGRFDESSLAGKGPGAILRRARDMSRAAVLFAGSADPASAALVPGRVVEISPPDAPLEEAIGDTAVYLERAVEHWLAQSSKRGSLRLRVPGRARRRRFARNARARRSRAVPRPFQPRRTPRWCWCRQRRAAFGVHALQRAAPSLQSCDELALDDVESSTAVVAAFEACAAAARLSAAQAGAVQPLGVQGAEFAQR